MIKAVHLTTVDIGGAHKAVIRIAESLAKFNVESTIVVRNKQNAGNEIEYNNTLLKSLISKAKNVGNIFFANEMIQNDLFGSDIAKLDVVRNADIVFIHWVNSFVEYKEIIRVLKEKKVILVLHDMEHITGGCHYSLECEGYKNGCISCPGWKTHLQRLGARHCNLLKSSMWSDCNCYAVAISEWMKETALVSEIVCGENKRSRIRRIWNPVNTDIFHPTDDESLRTKLGIDNKPLILFGADRIKDIVKGTKYIFDAIRNIDTTRYNIACFGTDDLPQEYADDFKFIRCLGRINDEQELARLYGIASVFVTAATQEAFGYTCCEALACSTPVVAFDTGGMKDQIQHKEWGYLAKMFDTLDLADGIEYCINNCREMGEKAVKFVESSFTYDVIGEQYYNFVEYILNEKK